MAKEVGINGAGSPKTHEEAQAIFKQAAEQVARGLREHGKGLDAARLQEVARHVERTAFIGGLNRENVNKSIAAAGQIPELSSSRQLDELRGAVGIMEKARPAQERSIANVPSRDREGVER